MVTVLLEESLISVLLSDPTVATRLVAESTAADMKFGKHLPSTKTLRMT